MSAKEISAIEAEYDKAIDDFLARGAQGWCDPQDPLSNLQVAFYEAGLLLEANAKSLGVPMPLRTTPATSVLMGVTA